MKNLSPKVLIASTLLTITPLLADTITLEEVTQATSIASYDELPSSTLKAELVAKNISHLSQEVLETLARIIGQLELAQNKALRTYFYEIFHPFFEGQKVSEAEVAAFKSNLSELTTDTELAAQMALIADAFCTAPSKQKSSAPLIKALAIAVGSTLGILAVYVLVNKYRKSNTPPKNPKESGSSEVPAGTTPEKTNPAAGAIPPATSPTGPTKTPDHSSAATEDEGTIESAGVGNDTRSTASPVASVVSEVLEGSPTADRAPAPAVANVHGPLFCPRVAKKTTKTPKRKRPPLPASMTPEDAIKALRSREPNSTVTVSLSYGAEEDGTPVRGLTRGDAVPFTLGSEAALPDAPSTGVPTGGILLPFVNGPSTLTAEQAIKELQKYPSNTPEGLTVAIVGQSDEDSDPGYSGDNESDGSDREEENREFSLLESPENIVNGSVMGGGAPHAVHTESYDPLKENFFLDASYVTTPGGSAPEHNLFTDSEPDTTFDESGVGATHAAKTATPLTEKRGLRHRPGKSTGGNTGQPKGDESVLDDSGFKDDLNTAVYGLDG